MIKVTFVNKTDEVQEYVVGPSVKQLQPGANVAVEVQPTERVGFTQLQGKENIASVLLAEFTDSSLLIYAAPQGVDA